MAVSPSVGESSARNTRSALILPEAAPARRDPSLVPFLSIMLLVLAFFIILTSHATLNAERTRAVTDSVQRQFAGAQEMVRPGAQGGPLEPEARDVLQNVLVSFQGLVPLDRDARQLSALEQMIRLPTELFFAADSAAVLDSRRSLIGEVMRALEQRPAGWGYELEILVQGDPPSPLTLDRAANLAAALAGGDGNQDGSGVVVALGRGDPAWMVLLIRLRPAAPASTEPGPEEAVGEELAP